MAALVQTYPQQSGTVTMLQTRSGSGSGMMSSQAQPTQQYGGPQQQRNNYHGMAGGANAPMTYRGAAAPIQPYAFTSTPSLHPTGQWQPLPAYNRASSSSAVPTVQSFDQSSSYPRARHTNNASLPNLPIGLPSGGSRDDSAIPPPGTRRGSGNPRPQSAYFANSTVQTTFTSASPAKNQPDRYRRPALRTTESSPAGQQGQYQGSAAPSGSGMASVAHLYTPPPNMGRERRPSPSNSSRPTSFYAKVPGSVDDMQLDVRPEETRRFRRRSMPALEAAEVPKSLAALDLKKPEKSTGDRSPTKSITDKEQQAKTARLIPSNSSARNGSSETPPPSPLNGLSNHNSICISDLLSKVTYTLTITVTPIKSANRNNVHNPTGNPAQLSNPSDQTSQDYPKLVTIPPRSSSTDASKRLANPSPLSKPVTMDSEEAKKNESSKGAAPAPASKPSYAQAAASSSSNNESPAVKQLAALNQKGGKLKSKTSRLRRALSFGSAAELRKAGAAEGSKGAGESSGAAKTPDNGDELDPEQARIAEQQEAAGLGHNIYAGSRMFAGSNDNISISSTASSASIMIRKMGRGMKKGGRSLAGLFRPKSVIGIPPPDSPEASQAAVSMVTVEAERERVNVNADPTPGNGGGTGYPRLERNSIDASAAAGRTSPERVGSSGTDNSNSRKSIVGGDRERAEVLAAVRKGILKYSNGSSTPSPKPVEKGSAFELPPVPIVSDSPISSAPSTPNDDASQKRAETTTVTIGSEDYFMTALRLRQDSKSAPGTPSGQGKRNATFSPRIVFYDTWTGQEYDRRSEIATCNRLTPMLAQQIKEELNTFKMEMEVHESSKIYTHFF
ncbi:hypothetical protein M406DRAFT_105118 [Cryphonectria parasitica EP155]|uniref:Protein BNI4 n=1 Tax=Cryphonectria parasitica (strain ATCC 38755 / EP155) TaxID=660469 RepID=A0A9P4YAP3_CRYP1|nr:uncharacterized protein M406DRAFT_105118 [Cryphonectria parasitica EP155]KAF3769888.1 hypothetical protein M406DRAFT_105118 [Cryphonectria parasitica EP155]